MKIHNMDSFRHNVLYPCVRVRTAKAGGSGQVIHASEKNGSFVLTCHHVVDDAIQVKEEWSQLLQRKVQKDVMSHVDVEFFVYKYKDRAVGSTSIQAEVVCYDKNEDIALLKLDADPREHKYDHVAKLLDCSDPADVAQKVDYMAEVITVGAALGSDPIVTTGNLCGFGIDIDNREYWLSTAPSIFGNCLTGESLVSLSDGTVKEIKDVVAGDKVLGYGDVNAGMRRSVEVEEAINAGVKKVFKIKSRNRTIRLSDNHPVVKVTQVTDITGRIRNLATWTQVKDLSEGDVIAVMSSHIPSEQTLGFNFADAIGQDGDRTSFMEFLGFFVGDGYKRERPSYGDLSLRTFNESLGKKYKGILEDLFGVNVTVEGNYETLRTSSTDLVRKLSDWGFDGLSKTETIPDWVMSTTLENQLAFLRGYCEADGHVHSSGVWVFEAENEWLMKQMRMLAIHAGLQVSNLSYRNRHTDINGWDYELESWSFQAYPEYSKNPNSHLEGDKSLLPDDLNYVKITSIEEDGEEETYDLKLRSCHAFFSDGVLVHNSGGATFLRLPGETPEDVSWEFVGMPARIAVTGMFGNDAITHMGFVVPVTRVVEFLKENMMNFFFDDSVSYEECVKLRKERREKSEMELFANVMKGSNE